MKVEYGPNVLWYRAGGWHVRQFKMLADAQDFADKLSLGDSSEVQAFFAGIIYRPTEQSVQERAKRFVGDGDDIWLSGMSEEEKLQQLRVSMGRE